VVTTTALVLVKGCSTILNGVSGGMLISMTSFALVGSRSNGPLLSVYVKRFIAPYSSLPGGAHGKGRGNRVTRIVYNGPLDAVEIVLTRDVVQRGKSIEVPDDLAESLASQSDWHIRGAKNKESD
jgi:hypothetical protein